MADAENGWLNRLASLRFDRAKGAAPHKPLLLLVVLYLISEPLRTGADVLSDAVTSPVAPALAPGPRCADCGSPVEDKVAAFCRFNRRRFGAKTVCRGCQSRYPA
jgi:hypothetical protein